jgi:gliding motility-associated lipoprotein GldD
MKNKFNILYLLLFSILILCCKETYIPVAKPRMYPKVEFPEKEMIQFRNADCNFNFIYPSYFNYQKDSLRFEENYKYPCWFDLYSKKLNTSLHFTFLDIKTQKDLDNHITDAFKLADEHNIKAVARKESVIENKEKKVFGLIFEMDGDVASPIQFFITDSTRNFVRASLYFNDKVNQDSTQIIYDFVKKDIDEMIKTFVWKN